MVTLISFIKPFYIIFPIFLLLKKKYKLFLYLCGFILGANILAIFISGIENNKIYYQKILPKTISQGVITEYKSLNNSTINGFILRNFVNNPKMPKTLNWDKKTANRISLFLRITLFAAVLLFIFFKNTNTREVWLLDFSLLILAFFLVQVYIHLAYLTFILIPFFCLFYDKLFQKNYFLVFLGILTFLLVGYNEKVIIFLRFNMPSSIFYDLRIYGQFLLLSLLIYLSSLRKFVLNKKILPSKIK